MNLDKLRIFYHAAMAKSFTNSGLHLSPSAISRHISDLEYWFKIKLFIRHPKGMELTPEGEKLLETCHTVFKELEGIRTSLTEGEAAPEGLLKIATPSGWISNIVVFLLEEFLEENPAVRVSVKSDDVFPDFNRGEADVALLPFQPTDKELVSEKLTSLNLGLFASAKYLRKHGVPKSVEDLKDHQMIANSEKASLIKELDWHLELGMPKGEKHTPYITINNLYYAAEAGYGIATLAKENALLRTGKLIEILPEVKGPQIDSYCVYPKRLEKSIRVKAFIKYITQSVRESSWYEVMDISNE